MLLALIAHQTTISIITETVSYFIKSVLVKNCLVFFVNYTDIKNIYFPQFIGLRLQVDHINPTKNQLFGEHRGATISHRLSLILIRPREIRISSDGNKITKVTVISSDKT